MWKDHKVELNQKGGVNEDEKRPVIAIIREMHGTITVSNLNGIVGWQLLHRASFQPGWGVPGEEQRCSCNHLRFPPFNMAPNAHAFSLACVSADQSARCCPPVRRCAWGHLCVCVCVRTGKPRGRSFGQPVYALSRSFARCPSRSGCQTVVDWHRVSNSMATRL